MRSSPITDFERRSGRRPRRPARRRPRSRARGGGRGRGPRCRTSAAAGRPRRSPATAPAGRAGRAPRAAVSTSIATTRVSPSTDRRSLRAADQPIDTWSSCIALDGIESTEAGTASRLSSETIAACVYCAIMWPLSTPGSCGEERRQPVAAGLVEEPVGTTLADRGHVGGDDREEVEHVGDRRPVEVAVRLDPALVGRARPGCRRPRRARGRRPWRRTRRCRGRRRAPAASSAASRRPGPGCSPDRGARRRRRSRRAAR